MSIVTTRALFCDHCANWYDGGDPLALAPDIRREAVRHGWKRRQGKDVCPDCHAESAAPQATAEPTDDFECGTGTPDGLCRYFVDGRHRCCVAPLGDSAHGTTDHQHGCMCGFKWTTRPAARARRNREA